MYPNVQRIFILSGSTFDCSTYFFNIRLTRTVWLLEGIGKTWWPSWSLLVSHIVLMCQSRAVNKIPQCINFFITVYKFLSPWTIHNFPKVLYTVHWTLSRNASADEVSSVVYLECLCPWAFQLRELGLDSYFGKYLSGQPRATLPSLSVCVYSAEKLFLPMSLKVSEAVKMGRNIVLGRERMKIVVRYWHNV